MHMRSTATINSVYKREYCMYTIVQCTLTVHILVNLYIKLVEQRKLTFVV